jgi:PPK2 family polyphosphate:nucleotide phosphotransferase
MPPLSCEKALAPWRPRKPGKGRTLDLSDYDPDARPFMKDESSAQGKKRLDRLAQEIDALQDLFYADRRHKLLVILQGTDASGKDGTIRHILARTSPLGVRAVGWRAPTAVERDHGYLWRIHRQVPGAGEIVVFNRSHYEDVLVPVVDGEIDGGETRRRFAQINDFERMLTETGTTVLKFLLHISADEQRERLQARLDDPAKNWKLVPDDLAVRKRWADYQRAYGAFLAATSTAWAPWTIVPANSKTHRNLMIATVLRDALQSLDLRYPAPDPRVEGLRVV